MCEHNNTTHKCNVCPSTSSVFQSLDELDFERGIWFAAQTGNLKRIQKLIGKGENVNAIDTAGYSSLHYAARNGYLEICEILIRNGADVDATTRNGGATPLHRACLMGKLEIVKLLLNHKADMNAIDNDGKTTLHRAAESQNRDLCEIIASSCPHLKTMKDFRGRKPMDYAQTEELANYLRVS